MRPLWIIVIAVSLSILAEGNPLQLSSSSEGLFSAENLTPTVVSPSVPTPQSDQRGFGSRGLKPSQPPWKRLIRTLPLSTAREPVDKDPPEKSTPPGGLPSAITAQSDQRGFISQDVKPSELPWNKLKKTLVVERAQGSTNKDPTGNPWLVSPSSKGISSVKKVTPAEIPWRNPSANKEHSFGETSTPPGVLPLGITPQPEQSRFINQEVKPSELPWNKLKQTLAASRVQGSTNKDLPGNPSKLPPSSERLSSAETFTPPSRLPMALNPQSAQRGPISQVVKPSEPPLKTVTPTWVTSGGIEAPYKRFPGMPTMDTTIQRTTQAGGALKTLRPSSSPSPSTVRTNHLHIEASTGDEAAFAAHQPTIKVVRRVTMRSLKKMMDKMEGLREAPFPTSKLAAEKTVGRAAPQSKVRRAILAPTLERHTGIPGDGEQNLKGTKKVLSFPINEETGESSNKVPKIKGRKQTLHQNRKTGPTSIEKLKAKLRKERTSLSSDESVWESSDEGLRRQGRKGALHPIPEKTIRTSLNKEPKGALHPISGTPDKTSRKSSNEESNSKEAKETSTTNHDGTAVKSLKEKPPKLQGGKGSSSLKPDKARVKPLHKISKLNGRKKMPLRNPKKTSGSSTDTESAFNKHREEVLAHLAAKLEFSTHWPGLNIRKQKAATLPLAHASTSEEPFGEEPRRKERLKPLHLNTQSPTVRPVVTLAEKFKLVDIKSNQVEEETAKPAGKQQELPTNSKVPSEHIAPGKRTASFLPRKQRDAAGDHDGASNKVGRQESIGLRWSGLSTAQSDPNKETRRYRKKRKRKKQWDKEEDESVGAAAIAAIISASLVALLVVLVIVAAVYWICRERRKRRHKRADEELGLVAGPTSLRPQWFSVQKDRRPTPYPMPPPPSVCIPMSFNPGTGTVEFINETVSPVNYEIYHSNGILSTSNASAPDRSGRRLSTIVEETRKVCRSKEKRRVIKRQTSDRRSSFGENISAARSIILGQSKSDIFEKKASERRRVIREAIAAHKAASGQRRHSLPLLEEIETARRVITPGQKHKDSVERASEKCRTIRSQLSAMRRPSFAQEIEVAKSVIVDMERIKHFHENWRLGNAGNVFTILDFSGTGKPVRGFHTSWRSEDDGDGEQILWTLGDSSAV